MCIRDSNRRTLVGEKLKTSNSSRVFLESLEHATAMQILHQNLQYKSTDALRKVKAEATISQRIDKKDIMKDLEEMQKQMKKTNNPLSAVPGFIQNLNTNQVDFKLHMYDANALVLLADKLRKEVITINLDATGGLFHKLPNDKTEEKKKNNLLLYSMVAESKAGSFVVAEMIARHHK